MKRFPSPDIINRIAKTLKIPFSELFTDGNSTETIKSMASLQKKRKQC
jgi:hypothetical protein